jgi:hypothetical protein
MMPHTRFCNCLLDYDYILNIVNFAILYLSFTVYQCNRIDNPCKQEVAFAGDQTMIRGFKPIWCLFPVICSYNLIKFAKETTN